MPGHLNIFTQFFFFLVFIFFDSYGLNLDSIYIFNVNREAKCPKVTFPRNNIPENQYIAIDTIISYKIRFSTNRDSVYINGSQIIGSKYYESKDTIKYSLKLSAAGRFVVYNTKLQLMRNNSSKIINLKF